MDDSKEQEELLLLQKRLQGMVISTSQQLDECKTSIAEEKKQLDFVQMSVDRLTSAAEGSEGLQKALQNQLKIECETIARMQEQETILAKEKAEYEESTRKIQEKIEEERALCQKIRNDHEAAKEQLNSLQERLENVEKEDERMKLIISQLDCERTKRKVLESEEVNLAAQMKVVEELLASMEQCKMELQQNYDEMFESSAKKEKILECAKQGGRAKIDVVIAENDSLREFLKMSAQHTKQLEEAMTDHAEDLVKVQDELERTKTHLALLEKEVNDAKKEVAAEVAQPESEHAAMTQDSYAKLEEEQEKAKQQIEQTIQQLHQRALSLSSSSTHEKDPATAREMKTLRNRKESVKKQEQEIGKLQAHIADIEAAIKSEQAYLAQKPKTLIDEATVELSFGENRPQIQDKKIPFTVIVAGLVILSLISWAVYLRVLVFLNR